MITELDVNQALVVGTIKGEVQLKTLKSQKNFLSFRVVTLEQYATRTGEYNESQTSHSVVLWNHSRAQYLSYMQEGMRVLVKGKIENRTYEDNTGHKKWVTQINAVSVIPLDENGQPVQPQAQQPMQQPVQQPMQAPMQQTMQPVVQPQSGGMGYQTTTVPHESGYVAPQTTSPPPDDDIPF